ncbi:MAG: hypothetical protein FWF90_05080 [Promicromonosporaceae bacterium]|nr:hypothetical protein [Promicromonosporaceae bacterium]
MTTTPLPAWATERHSTFDDGSALVARAASTSLGTVVLLGSQAADGTTDVAAGFVLELPPADVMVRDAAQIRELANALADLADALDAGV